jgi:hypothetical protein
MFIEFRDNFANPLPKSSDIRGYENQRRQIPLPYSLAKKVQRPQFLRDSDETVPRLDNVVWANLVH